MFPVNHFQRRRVHTSCYGLNYSHTGSMGVFNYTTKRLEIVPWESLRMDEFLEVVPIIIGNFPGHQIAPGTGWKWLE